MIIKLENSPVTDIMAACQLQAINVIREQQLFEQEDDMAEAAL